MFAIWVTVAFVAFIAIHTAMDVQRHHETRTHVQSTNAAASFMSYRRAIQSSLRANPIASGRVPDQQHQLIGHLPMGASVGAQWDNFVQSGQLFVFSRSVPSPALVNELRRDSRNSRTIGIARDVSGQRRLFSFEGDDTGVLLPSSIPVGSLVMPGN